MKAGTTYNVSLLNFKDAAGNLTVINPIATTVNVTSDATVANVTNVTVVGNSSIEVTFDKDMDPATITSSTLRLLDTNLASLASDVNGEPIAKVVDGVNSKRTFVMKLQALKYNTSNVFNGIVAYTSNIKDLLGNDLIAGTALVTASKDTVAPAYVSAAYKNVVSYNGITTAHGAIVVKFSEAVTASAAAAKYSIVDDLGSVINTPIANATINPNDKTELVLSLSADVTTTAKTYAVVIPTDAVEDTSLEINKSVAVNTSVDVTVGAPVAVDKEVPTVKLGTTPVVADTILYAGSTINMVIADEGTAGLDMATLTNTNNYKLNGVALPSGSYITYATDTKIASINIPANKIAKDGTYSLNVNGIKDKSGNTMAPFVSSVALLDDIKPTISSIVATVDGAPVNATIASDGKVSLAVSDKSVTSSVTITMSEAVGLNGIIKATVKNTSGSADYGTTSLSADGKTITIIPTGTNGMASLAGGTATLGFSD